MVLDIATSVASNGAIRTYAREGKPMPEGWVISREDGEPITDGRRLAEGMFVPIGDYKGSGLALVLGLLGGPLNRRRLRPRRQGRQFRAGAREQYRPIHHRARRRRASCRSRAFTAEMDRHIRDLACFEAASRRRRIRIPGQGRVARRAERQTNGVPLSAALMKQLDELATSLAITPVTERIVAWPKRQRTSRRRDRRSGASRCNSIVCRAWLMPASHCRSNPASTSISCCSCFGRPDSAAAFRRMKSRGSREDRGLARTAVIPLRAVRRALKAPPALMAAGTAEAFRTRVKAVELEAERLQQEAMYELERRCPSGPAGPRPPMPRAPMSPPTRRMLAAPFSKPAVEALLAAFAALPLKAD